MIYNLVAILTVPSLLIETMKRPLLTRDCTLSVESSSRMHELVTRHRKTVQLICLPRQVTLLDQLLGNSPISTFVYFLN